MGHSKKFHRKEQRNHNKAMKSHKERQHTEKNKAAAAYISEENKDSDSHDFETVTAFRVTIADTCTNPKMKDSQDLEIRGPNSDGVFIPKTEIRSISDDQTPRCINPGTFCGDQNAYYYKSWHPKSDRNFIRETETRAIFKAAPKYDYYLKNWNTKDDGVYNAKTEMHTGSDDQTTAATRSCGGGVDLKTMAQMGVSVVHTHAFPICHGPVLNSAEVLKSWNRDGDGMYIAKPEDLLAGSNARAARAARATSSCGCTDLETMAAYGISVIYSHEFPKYHGPPVSADVLKSWSRDGDGLYLAKPEDLLAGFKSRTARATSSCDSVDLETKAELEPSVIHSHMFPRYCGPVSNSAEVLKSWNRDGDGMYIAKPEDLLAGFNARTARAKAVCKLSSL